MASESITVRTESPRKTITATSLFLWRIAT